MGTCKWSFEKDTGGIYQGREEKKSNTIIVKGVFIFLKTVFIKIKYFFLVFTFKFCY